MTDPLQSLHLVYPPELPISGRAAEIVETLKNHPVVVIAGETGSGKTTQIPKMCLQAGLTRFGAIACTQPRRVAALSIARRLAEELKTPYGGLVGAKIRFTDQTRRDSLIKVMTDGMLLSEIQGNPLLKGYGAVIVDEAHERSLNIDFLIGYLKQILPRRRDLKVVITSATINTEAVSAAFDGAPIIEVSGRTWPVDVVYAPIDEILEETGECTYIEATVRAVETVIEDNRPGDILVFLPGEKDIREVRELLEGRSLGRAEVLPLFGRLSNAEQQCIFAPGQNRRIILATNIAETSLTIPGIRYVIDSGLARMSRYHPQTHTLRLPIEKTSQASANQRKGRAGRVEAGICIRLYSEQDFLTRPQFTTPEILRSNLAAVILRMIAFRIGDIETFPFMDPPARRSIQAGYELLQQLGALDELNAITELGKQLAHLPCDPTVGRMLLQANHEGCLREVLVISSALSIQDPRERPSEERETADRMHRTFEHPESDFLTLLNIWDRYHDQTEKLTQSQLRKFCRLHFLSYQRMREWRDIHQQLSRVLDDLGGFRLNAEKAEYHQIHRALLAGLLNGLATRDEGNHYHATHSRRVMLFPGSTLFSKTLAKAQRKKGKPPPAETGSKAKSPAWIMCAEWMETQRLYARTVARIQPEWILDLGKHLLKSSFSDPRYDEKDERVVARERMRLFGLEIATRNVSYTRINPSDATEIFIRSALIEGNLRGHFAFQDHNREVRRKVESLQTRLRSSQVWALDERVYQFYHQRLQNVGSANDLRKFIRDQAAGNDAFLRFEAEDLLEADGTLPDASAFPEAVQIEGVRFLVDYTYKPGEADDGATLKVPVAGIGAIDAAKLDWVVPGFVSERIEHLMRALPKTLRQDLFPIPEKAALLSKLQRPADLPLTTWLSQEIHRRYGVLIREQHWDHSAIPAHLLPRVELVDEEDRVIASGRSWDVIENEYQKKLRQEVRPEAKDVLEKIRESARLKWERHGLVEWSFNDFPLEMEIGRTAGVPVLAYPGLRKSDEGISLLLYSQPEPARRNTPAAFFALCQRACGPDLAWLEKDLRQDIRRIALIAASFYEKENLQREVLALLHRYLFFCDSPLPLQKATFDAVVQRVRELSRGLVSVCIDLLLQIFNQRQDLYRLFEEQPSFQTELNRLVYPGFLREVGYKRLQHFPRYLTALQKRHERARIDPRKDAAKAAQIEPLIRKFNQLQPTHPNQRKIKWLLEELRVQTYAQELGTADKVSPQRIEALF